jgi:hypothetical protein
MGSGRVTQSESFMELLVTEQPRVEAFRLAARRFVDRDIREIVRLQLATEPSFKATNAKLAFPCGMGVQPKGVMNHVPFVCLAGAKARFFLAI